MLAQIGNYDFGGHTAVRVIRSDGPSAATIEGWQFNFMVRSRVAREDGDEYLFNLYIVVIRPDRSVDEKLAEAAANQYSLDGDIPSAALSELQPLESLDPYTALDAAHVWLEKKAGVWDWDEEVELLGLARLMLLPRVT
jgi:hypothetical protein